MRFLVAVPLCGEAVVEVDAPSADEARAMAISGLRVRDEDPVEYCPNLFDEADAAREDRDVSTRWLSLNWENATVESEGE